MANTVKHGKGSKVFIGAYDFSGQGRSIDLTVFEGDMADATVFTSLARVKSPGSYSAKVDHKGIFTNAVSGWDNWLHSKLGNMSGQPISVLLGQPAEGDIAYHGEILTSNVKVPVKIDDVIAVEGTYQIHRALARGTLLAHRTSNLDVAGRSWSGAGYLIGPIAANEALQVTVHIISKFQSSTSYTVKVQQSSGDSVYTDITGGSVSPPVESGDVTSAILRIAGPIDDYVRAVGLQTNYDPRCNAIVVASKIHGSE